jgi:uncharacterized protein YdaU (DUF1376 family)
MQWYAHYPGDYGRDTAHLSMTEDGAYRRLLDHYYSTGGPMPSDRERLYRLCRAFRSDEREAVDTVLKQFFVLSEDGFHNGRADKELDKRSECSSKLSESGKRGAERRWRNGQANGQANGHPNGLSMASPHPHPQIPKEKAGAAAPKSSIPVHEQKRRIEARDGRLDRESEAQREAQVGAGPKTNGPVNRQYLEFAELSHQRKIPAGITYQKWKSLTCAERDELVSPVSKAEPTPGAKPGPALVRRELELLKIGNS